MTLPTTDNLGVREFILTDAVVAVRKKMNLFSILCLLAVLGEEYGTEFVYGWD